MRDENGKFAKGSSGNPAGRPKRADEQFLVDIWEKSGQEQFGAAIANGERWALKTLVDKLYPNQKPAAPVAETTLPTPLLSNVRDLSLLTNEELEQMIQAGS